MVHSSRIETLYDLLQRNALHFGANPALIAMDGTVITYAELRHRAEILVRRLTAIGIRPGDRVAVMAGNTVDMGVCLLAVPSLGAVVCPVNSSFTAAEVAELLDVSGAALLLCDTATKKTCLEAAKRFPTCQVLDLPELETVTPASAELRPPRPEQPALLFFTSGSTSRPKAAVHTHRGLITASSILAYEFGFQETERSLNVLPVTSAFIEQFLPVSFVGGANVMIPRQPGVSVASLVWPYAARLKATHVNLVPTLMARLLQQPDLPKASTSLRLVTYASEPMPWPVIESWMKQLPQIAPIQFYGMTEVLPLTVLKPWAHRAHPGSVGRPMLGTQIKLLDEAGEPVPTGSVGEIVIHTSAVMEGYWNNEAATAEVLQDGWLRTGDLGTFDAHGYLSLTGRRSEIIITGGYSVSPAEVEEVLYAHPSVAQAAVFSLPSSEWGESVHAAVVYHPGQTLSDEDLINHCRENLARYKVPKHIHVLDDLPRTGIGKISRKLLREQLLTGGLSN